MRICHNHTTACWGEGAKTLLKYILRPWNKLFATDFFACGETAGRWMYGNRCFEQGRVSVMSNAIDTQKFAFDPGARKQLRDELKISQDAFVIGHVGRFMYQKNHSFLIDIFAEVLKNKPGAVLLLVGEGELMGNIREKVRARGISGSVVFTGAREDVNKLYSAMDVFCLPSFYEGMPVVAWEAQANGLPCVFSERITKETSQSNNSCQFLHLEQGVKEWAIVVCSMGSRTSCTVLDIGKEAKSFLCSFYIKTIKSSSDGN